MNKKRTALITATVVMLVIGLSGISAMTTPVKAVQGGTPNGTTITTTIDANPHWQWTYGWTIDKKVSPDTWNLFQGDSGTSHYTVSVTKDSGKTTGMSVDGTITVTNGGQLDTTGLAISVQVWTTGNNAHAVTDIIPVDLHKRTSP